MARARRSAQAAATEAPSSAAAGEEFKCPECGRTFERAAALGAHRRRAHGVAGASASASAARSRRRSSTRSQTDTTRSRQRTTTRPRAARDSKGVNRDALLKTLFPTGVPPRESVIREVAAWLDEAERLAKLR